MNLNFLRIALIVALLAASSLVMGKEVVATAQPATALAKGQNVVVPVVIDMAQLPEKLGSFTAKLSWDESVLQFKGFTGGNAAGFESPVVNESRINEGRLVFANANPFGADAAVNVINVEFSFIGEDANASVNLEFTAMAAAETFEDLLPYLVVKDSDFEVGNAILPNEFGLQQNYPNPFNPTTTISYALPKDVNVNVVIFNALGQQVKNLANGFQEAGNYSLVWDATNDLGERVSSGVYYYTLNAGDFSATYKMVLLK